MPAGNTDNEFVFGLGVRAGSGTCYVDNLKLRPNGAPEPGPDPTPGGDDPTPGPDAEQYPTGNILSEGAWGFENNDLNGWNSWAKDFDKSVANTGYASNHCLKVENKAAAGMWEKQCVLALDNALEKGKTYTLTFKAKADVAANINTAITMKDNPWTAQGSADHSLTTEWAEYTFEQTIDMDNIDRIVFNLGETVTSYYIDNISLIAKAGQGEPDPTPGPDSDAKKIVLDDFEKYAVGATPYTVENANGGFASVVSADADNKALNFTTGSYKNGEYLALTFTLPQGKTLSDYDVLTFDYAFAASGNDNMHKDIKVCIDSKDTAVGTINSQNAPDEWKTMSIALENVQGGNSFTLYIGGINASVLSMNIDNIVIKTSDADTPTNINLQSISNGNAQEMFSIGGQRVNGSYHGIVIINGKKVVVK